MQDSANEAYLWTITEIRPKIGTFVNAKTPVTVYVNNVNNGGTSGIPTDTPANPSGATAVCNDGTLSYSQHRQGTCSHHRGVARWL
ncbi:DUF3761 domain-containing protein [Actinoallomurus sp. NPDC050550]|uniref:DUF3761 domain-containing protein n=1 Tax=Actinoallomurus sp. NPDC050550 TaxID=3154937 RepID=UPI0034109968